MKHTSSYMSDPGFRKKFKKYVKGIRKRILRNLILIATVWLYLYKTKSARYLKFVENMKRRDMAINYLNWVYDLTVEDVKEIVECDDKTAWEYREVYRKIRALT